MRTPKFQGNIFVANLPKEFTDTMLAELFDGFGIVIDATIARDTPDSPGKGFGLVDIAPAAAAKEAIAAMNGKVVGGRKIEVRASDPEMSLTIKSTRAPRRGPPMPSRGMPAEAIVSRPRPSREFVVEYRPVRRRA